MKNLGPASIELSHTSVSLDQAGVSQVGLSCKAPNVVTTTFQGSIETTTCVTVPTQTPESSADVGVGPWLPIGGGILAMTGLGLVAMRRRSIIG